MEHRYAGLGGLAGLGTLAACAAIALALPAPASGASDAEDGLRATPHLGWSAGRHSVEIGIDLRYRLEAWEAFVPSTDVFHGFRTRIGAEYAYGERFRLVAQGQHTAVLGLSDGTSGTGAVYRASSKSGTARDVDGFYVSQLFAELQPVEETWLRVGREFVRGGTYVPYDDASWRYLKGRRVSQRLLGTVGWTHGERAYDGVNAFTRRRGHAVHGFALEPTTGVFEVERGYRRQRDVWVAGLDYTLEPGTWRDDTELGLFFLAYEDHRDPLEVAGLFGDIEVYTLGARWLGVYPVGAGRVDLLLWGAFQLGDYVDVDPSPSPFPVDERDQLAWAAIGEAGYQLPDAWAAPHVRVGVNYASGDDDPSSGTRHTFFNVLPTNHGYYGTLDQFAFQNLVDLLVQLRVQPLECLSLEFDYHRFWLAEDEDFRWAGSGAFSRGTLGYVRNPSQGSHDAGHELDATATLRLHRTLELKGGYSRLWGGDVFGDDDADWLYVQATFRY